MPRDDAAPEVSQSQGAGAPDAVGDLAKVLAAEIMRQQPTSLDLSEKDDLTVFAVFEALNLQELAASAMAALRPGEKS